MNNTIGYCAKVCDVCGKYYNSYKPLEHKCKNEMTPDEREGFYEKLWKEFCSLQSGDARNIVVEVELLRTRVKRLTEALIDIEISPRILHKVNLVENMQNIARMALEGEE